MTKSEVDLLHGVLTCLVYPKAFQSKVTGAESEKDDKSNLM